MTDAVWVRVSTDAYGNQTRYRLRVGGDWRNIDDWIEDDSVPWQITMDGAGYFLEPAAIGDGDE